MATSDWVISKEGYLHKWGDPVYYDPEVDSGFQVYRGQRIGAMSFAAFGEDLNNARESYESWLRQARAAYVTLMLGTADPV